MPSYCRWSKLTSSKMSKCRKRPTGLGWRLSSTEVVLELVEVTATTLNTGSRSRSQRSESRSEGVLLIKLVGRFMSTLELEASISSSNSSLEAKATPAPPPVWWLPTMVSGSTPNFRNAPSSLSYSSLNFLKISKKGSYQMVYSAPKRI